MREEKSYNGELMRKGTENERVILDWLSENFKSVLDFREFRLTQRIDVDFGVETIDGNFVLAEIKSDKHISEDRNLCFEVFRINHFVTENQFYLGWGYRSPAQKLIIRNPDTGKVFVFDFLKLRSKIGSYIAEKGKTIRMLPVETDKQKTTFNFLIPMHDLTSVWKKFQLKKGT